MIPGALNPMLLSGGGVGYQIQRALRLRKAATAGLSKTFGALGDQKTFVISEWLKRGVLTSGDQVLYASWSNVSNYFAIFFNASDLLRIVHVVGGAAYTNLTSVAVFRDPTAHMHMHMKFDTTQATAANRIVITRNNDVLTFTGTYPSINDNLDAWLTKGIGFDVGGDYYDGLISEYHRTDGITPAASSFGQIESGTGQWTAMRYTGTYGANGFYLPFTDTSSTTNLCLDASGNGNHWTPNNISTTAGVTYDSMTDVPLAYGTTDRGNYATMNPLQSGSYVTLSNGNLTVTGNTSVNSGLSLATQDANGQKIYFEGSGNWSFGAITLPIPQSALINAEGNSINYGFGVRYDGSVYGISGEVQTGLSGTFSFTNTDTMAFAIDAVYGAIYVRKNGIWLNSGDPTSGAAKTGAFYKWTPSSTRGIFPTMNGYNGTVGNINFGQRPFTYTPPTGFKALHTGNLTSDTVATSGTFPGNLSTDGPDVWMNGSPETLTINGNAVTWGTHADKTAGGFKVRSSSSSYNNTGSNTWVATILSPSLKSSFRNQLAKANP